VTGCWRLNVAGKAVTYREIHQQRTTPIGSDSFSLTAGNFKVSTKQNAKIVLMINIQHFLEAQKYIKRSITKHRSTQNHSLKNRA